MNNEPVAYVSEEDLRVMETHLCNLHLKPKDKDIPLYTHPVKELTDEEIADLIANKVTDSDMIKQALRKAQER